MKVELEELETEVCEDVQEWTQEEEKEAFLQTSRVNATRIISNLF